MTRPRKKSRRTRKRDSNPGPSALEADASTTRPTRRLSVRGQARTFVDVLEANTGVPRDCLPAAMADRVSWRKKAKGCGGGGVVGGLT